jgi:hypothetical protein
MDGLPIDRGGVAGRGHDDPLDRQRAGGGQGRLVALRGQLAEGVERLQLTAGSPVELAERAVEGDRPDERDRQDVGGDIPWGSVEVRRASSVGPPGGLARWAGIRD